MPTLPLALAPLLAGYLFSLSPFGWPLASAGACKGLYDLLLLKQFGERAPARGNQTGSVSE